MILCSTTVAYLLNGGRKRNFSSWVQCLLEISISSLGTMEPDLIISYEPASIIFLFGFTVEFHLIFRLYLINLR